MSDYLLITTTTPTEQMAQQIAAELVEERLAACVQIHGPIQSVYRWQGKIEQASEWLCTIKSKREKFPHINQRILELHEYDCPEIVAVPIADGSKDYLQWIDEQID